MRNQFMHFGQSVLLGLLLFLFACNNPNTQNPSPIDPNPPAAQVPAVPGGFTSSNLTTSAVTLSWEAAPNTQDYTLERGEGAAPSSWTAITLSAPAVLTHTDTTLNPSSTYTYRLRANNTAGSSDWATLNLTTPALPPNAPAVPSNFASSNLTTSSVRLSWSAVAGATRYNLERGLGNSPSTWVALTLSAPNATQFDDTVLAPQTTYSYRLRAGNADGDSAWVVLSLTTPAALPAAPANFASSNLTAGGVRLTWDTVTGVTRYVLERGLGNNPTIWEPLTLTSLTATRFNDETLEPQTSYRYRLRSSNPAGDSDWVFVNLTTPAAPAVSWRVEIWASGLRDPNNASSPDVVWSMRFTPDNTRMLYTPRDRTTIEVRSIDVATKQVTTILGTALVRDENFAGILGMTLDPDFAQNNYLYICYSTFINGTQRRNRVSRFTLGSRLTDERELLVLAGGFTQNGCRVIFGPDGKLYASMGYTGDFSIAQDLTRMGGKILRINPDGTIPADNPYRDRASDNPSGNAIWSFGHRNPQGLAFRPGNNQLWSTEHGENTRDELNLIVRGQNYGWPLCAGTQAFNTPMFVANEPAEIQNFRCTGPNLTATNYQPAIRQYEQDGSSSIAPSNLIFYTGRTFLGWRNNLFFVTLRTGRMYRLVLNGNAIASEELMINNTYGRLRDIMVGPEGYIYFSTDTGFIYRIVPQ